MTIRLYMDQHIRAEVTEGLRRRGVDVVTAFEDGTADWDDERLLDRATHLGRLLFSQDRDLLVIASHWQSIGREFAGLVYARQREISDGQAIHDLVLLTEVYEPGDMHNRVEYLPYS